MHARWGTLAALSGALAMFFASLVGTGDAAAGPCGTVGTPGACSLDVGGTVQYSATNFTFISANASGGGNIYTGEDISIDLSAGGGLIAILTFQKIPGPNGASFFANPGETAGFIFSYDLTVSALLPGDIEFTSITTTMLASTASNGSASVQGIVAGQVNCNVVNGAPDKTCDLDGTGPLDLGDIISLAGNSGNAAILRFTNEFDVAFTPDTPPTDVPEPGSLALLLAASGLVMLRRRR